MNELYRANDLAKATQAIDRELGRKRHGESEVLKLERAMLELADGRPREAEQTLLEVRDRFDEHEKRCLAEPAVMLLTDDTYRAYPGEDYEKVLLRAMLAISNLMVDGRDAGAYALQMVDKQQQIIQTGAVTNGENAKLAYNQVALGPYLHGMLREETHMNYDDVERAAITVCNWEPEFPYGRLDLERARSGHHSERGNGVLYVFAFVGRGPHKEEAIEVASSVSLLIADQILSATTGTTLPPTIAPIKVPVVVASEPYVAQVGVDVDGQPAGTTATITDVGRMAVEQYQAIYPQIIARAVVRRAVKKGVVVAAKKVGGVQSNSLVNLAADAAGVVWEATESTDTRSWSLLPDKIQAIRLELSAGRHRIDLRAISVGRALGPSTTQIVEIRDGRNSYMLANFPDLKPVGKVLVR